MAKAIKAWFEPLKKGEATKQVPVATIVVKEESKGTEQPIGKKEIINNSKKLPTIKPKLRSPKIQARRGPAIIGCEIIIWNRGTSSKFISPPIRLILRICLNTSIL